VQRCWVEVRSRRPGQRPDRTVQDDGIEDCQVLEWPEDLAFQHRPEIDPLLTTVLELKGEDIRPNDVKVLDAMNGVCHARPSTVTVRSSIPKNREISGMGDFSLERTCLTG
jgi:hypothetical protein